MTIISGIQFEGRYIPLIEESLLQNNENIFSVIVGKNGVGKSRLLSEISDTLIRRTLFTECQKVIAISISPFDKFKSSYRQSMGFFRPSIFNKTTKHFNSVPDYHYIGMKDGIGRSAAISLIASAGSGLIIFPNQ